MIAIKDREAVETDYVRASIKQAKNGKAVLTVELDVHKLLARDYSLWLEAKQYAHSAMSNLFGGLISDVENAFVEGDVPAATSVVQGD